jgi:hypothetical protein
VSVTANGLPIGHVVLADDWAGAAGVLSTATGLEPGSYGQLVSFAIPPETWRRVTEKAADGALTLRFAFRRPGGADAGGGLALYGHRFGSSCTPPTVLLTFGKESDALGRNVRAEAVGPRWNRENPYVLRWRVLAAAPHVRENASSRAGDWREVEASIAPFRGYAGRSVSPPSHAMPLVELGRLRPGGEGRAEALAVAYVQVPENRRAAVWTGATDPWKVVVTRSDGRKLPPIGLYHVWLGVVPDCRMARLELTKGWNEIRLWTAKDTAGPWQFGVAVTDAKGQTMRDVRFAAQKPPEAAQAEPG